MPDLSFKVWHVVLKCDDPRHVRSRRHPDDRAFDENDYETVEPEATLASYRADLRFQGWIFHRDGRVTCPECAKIGGNHVR